jgi:hypothetical protein
MLNRTTIARHGFTNTKTNVTKTQINSIHIPENNELTKLLSLARSPSSGTIRPINNIPTTTDGYCPPSLEN